MRTIAKLSITFSISKLARLIFAVYIVFSCQLSSANYCRSFFISQSGGNFTDQQIASWREKLRVFLSSKEPNYNEVRELGYQLETLDTSHPAVQRRLAPLVAVIKSQTTSLFLTPLSSTPSLSEIKGVHSRLRFLNSPGFRSLVGDHWGQEIGRLKWIFENALYNDKLDLEHKISRIRLETKKPKASWDEGPVAPFPDWAQVEVRRESIDEKDKDVGLTISCDGLCGSRIHKLLSQQIDAKEVDQLRLNDGEVVLKSNPDQSSNFVLIADGLKLPLSELLKRILNAAENGGLSSITLPVIRTGDAFGAVENSNRQISHEIVKGISEFLNKSSGKLKKIEISVPQNAEVAKLLEDKIQVQKRTRERSLRDTTRQAELSGKGFVLLPSPQRKAVVKRDSPIYDTMLKPWKLAHMLQVHKPIFLAPLTDKEAFSRKTVSVLNMPIMMPGIEGFRVVAEHEQFTEMLQKILDHEVEVNPDLRNFYAYMTVDQRPVQKGKSHRREGIHIDGVQGARYVVKLPPEHTYSASDSVGTIFYDQPFDLRHIDPARHHVHAELERQALPKNRIVLADYNLYFWDSYSVHETNRAPKDLVRTFVRVEFSKKIYDGVGDTQSPLFDYNWERVDRSIPENLNDKPLF